jgi:hypothetical protein
VHAEVSVTASPTELSRHMRHTALTGFVDQAVGAIDRWIAPRRGAPRPGAGRSEGAKRGLLEVAGKKEVRRWCPLSIRFYLRLGCLVFRKNTELRDAGRSSGRSVHAICQLLPSRGQFNFARLDHEFRDLGSDDIDVCVGSRACELVGE